MIKVLNLYAGIGGNRKLWDNVKVTAIENDKRIATIYQDLWPDDVVIITDAHQFLLDNFEDYDFIWSSPPCPTHSDIRRCGVHSGQYKALYPDMKLYEEIIFLKYFAKLKTKWVVENVVGYYEPLIKPHTSMRHYFWSNFHITNEKFKDRTHNDIVGSSVLYDFDLSKYSVDDKRKILRNMVNPKLGKHIFDCAFKGRQLKL